MKERVQRDRRAWVGGLLPFGHGRRLRYVEKAVAHQDANDGVKDALRHRPRRLRIFGGVAIGVALGDDTPAVDDEQLIGAIGGRRLGFGEGGATASNWSGRAHGWDRFN